MASREFKLHCKRCSTLVAVYKKSGSGKLIRLYLDRVAEPKALARLKIVSDKKDLPPFQCPSCTALLGTPMIENRRPAYRLIPGALGKA